MGRCFDFQDGQAQRPELFWVPPSLLSEGYQGIFHSRYRGRGAKVTTHSSSDKVKKEWSYMFTSAYAFQAFISITSPVLFTWSPFQGIPTNDSSSSIGTVTLVGFGLLNYR